jgi:hypothetical protein
MKEDDLEENEKIEEQGEQPMEEIQQDESATAIE